MSLEADLGGEANLSRKHTQVRSLTSPVLSQGKFESVRP